MQTHAYMGAQTHNTHVTDLAIHFGAGATVRATEVRAAGVVAGAPAARVGAGDALGLCC